MSSATSTEVHGGDPGLRPWQFFMLAGMLSATAVVLIVSGQSPASLIVLSVTIVSASLVALGTYRALAPLVVPETETAPPLAMGRARAALEREKALALRSIKELEFDYAMKKVAKADYEDMSARLRSRAMGLMRQLDEGGGYRDEIQREVASRLKPPASPGFSPGEEVEESGRPERLAFMQCECGSMNDADARFCKNCGTKLGAVEGNDGVEKAGKASKSALLTLVFALVAASAAAQQMPDPSQMAGRPLPAPELETGMVSVRVVRERMGNNVTDQPVTLKAKDRSLNARTDAQGRATFGDVPPGTMITVETVVDGETLHSQQFAVPASGGIRVALIAGLEAAAARDRAAREEAAKMPARQGVVVFGGESRVILEFQDDNLQVFYLLDIVNNARTPIDVGQPMFIVLPEGASGAGALDGSSPLAAVQGDRIRLNGPFPPGTTQVQVGYRFPYRGDSASITQTWPAAFEQVFVAAEKVGALQMASPQFKQQQEANAGGAPFVMATGGRINAGETLTINLSGLPHRTTLLRDTGLAIGGIILAIGFWAAFSGGKQHQDRRDELAKRKESLLTQLVSLEEQHRQGRVDERRYASRRQSLVAQLERLMGEMDGSPA